MNDDGVSKANAVDEIAAPGPGRGEPAQIQRFDDARNASESSGDELAQRCAGGGRPGRASTSCSATKHREKQRVSRVHRARRIQDKVAQDNRPAGGGWNGRARSASRRKTDDEEEQELSHIVHGTAAPLAPQPRSRAEHEPGCDGTAGLEGHIGVCVWVCSSLEVFVQTTMERKKDADSGKTVVEMTTRLHWDEEYSPVTTGRGVTPMLVKEASPRRSGAAGPRRSFVARDASAKQVGRKPRKRSVRRAVASAEAAGSSAIALDGGKSVAAPAQRRPRARIVIVCDVLPPAGSAADSSDVVA